MATVQPTTPFPNEPTPTLIDKPDLIIPGYPRADPARLVASALLALFGVAFALPLLWIILASFDKDATWSAKIPNLTLDNFATAIDVGGLRPLVNSGYLAVVATVVATVCAVLAAYPLARRPIPFGRTYLLVTLFASGLPLTIMLVSVYQMYVLTGLIDSLFWTGMFLAAGSVPFAIWLMKTSIQSVPYELEEAAMVEGAGSVRILLTVVLPLVTPGLVVTAITTFAAAWGMFVVPLVLNFKPEDTPGSIAIFNFTSAFVIQVGPLAAYSLLFSLPVLVIYLLIGRRLQGDYVFGGGIVG